MTVIPQDLNHVQVETNFLLPSPAGFLELLLTAAPNEAGKAALAIICHPHPLYGGAMQNKVVTTLSNSFQALGMQTLRFNFRGVGRSTGSYAEGIGELADLATVLAWVKGLAPEKELWLAGFSFGAYIAIRAASEGLYKGLVTVAPPVNHFPLPETLDITCPWLLIQGEQDEIVPTEEVLAWVNGLNRKPTVRTLAAAGHFFHGNLTLLKEMIIKELKSFS